MTGLDEFERKYSELNKKQLYLVFFILEPVFKVVVANILYASTILLY